MRRLKQNFWRNVLPSVASFAFSGLYTIVDGFFVGQNVGDQGLAAINVAYPLAALIQAVGAGIGMAGAIWIAISAGEGSERRKNQFLGNTLFLLLAASLATTLLLLAAYRPLLGLFGASGPVLAHASAYLEIIALGTGFQLCAVGLMPVIRNYGGAMAAMAAMMTGFGTNILLDWVFTALLRWGTAGAAAATVIGQAAALVPCVVFILRRRGAFRKMEWKPARDVMRRIFITAVSPFGAVISPMLVLVIINKAAFAYGGDAAVACYAVVSYMTAVAYLLLQGIGDGVQPLIGSCYGAGETEKLHALRRMALTLSLLVSAACLLLLFGTRSVIPGLFGASEQVAAMYQGVLLYCLAGLPFLAVSKVATSYFYATGQNPKAYLLIYSEPILTAVAAGLLLPAFWRLQGVWAAIPVTQGLIALCGGALLRLQDRDETSRAA